MGKKNKKNKKKNRNNNNNNNNNKNNINNSNEKNINIINHEKEIEKDSNINVSDSIANSNNNSNNNVETNSEKVDKKDSELEDVKDSNEKEVETEELAEEEKEKEKTKENVDKKNTISKLDEKNESNKKEKKNKSKKKISLNKNPEKLEDREELDFEVDEKLTKAETEAKKEEEVEIEIHNTAEIKKAEEIKTDFDLDEDIAKKKKKAKIITISVIVVAIIVIIFSTIFALFNISNPKILRNVYINNIPVGEMLVKDAESKLNYIYDEKSEKDITLKYNDYEYKIRPSQIDYNPGIQKAVTDAYNFGRSGFLIENNYNIFMQFFRKKKIAMDSNFNKELFDEVIEDLVSKIPGKVKQPSYNIEGTTLFVYPGEEGIGVNKEKLKAEIIKNFDENTEETVVEIPVENTKPDDIDIEKIYNEVKKDPIDASYDAENKKLIVDEKGIDFDISLEDAKKIFLEEKEEYQIPLKIIEPKVKLSDLNLPIFDNIISTYTTRYNPGQVDRTKNLQIAARKINGYILKPGEVFSYNRVLGRRTLAAGYRNAAIFSNGKVVDDIGGGICQVSSTLYGAALKANLQIVERTNHGLETSYSKPGLDATVYYGSIDFKFKNNREVPIRINASVSNGNVTVTIRGENVQNEKAVITTELLRVIPRKLSVREDPTLEEGTEVVEQAGADGKVVRTYKEVYIGGKSYGRKAITTDTYNPKERVVRKGTKLKEEPAPKPEPEPEPTKPAEEPDLVENQEEIPGDGKDKKPKEKDNE